MPTTLASRRPRADATAAPPRLGLEPPPGRRARLPEVAVGAALMVGFTLAGVLWHLSSTDKEAVLALAAPVGRGEVIEAGDVRVVYVSSDDAIASLAGSESPAVVGRVAAADLPAGAVLNRDSVLPGAALGPGEAVVGLSLDPGQVPLARLARGDRVDVVGGDGPVLARDAEVYEVQDLRAQAKTVVSVRLPRTQSAGVAAAAEAGGLRLVLVGRS